MIVIHKIYFTISIKPHSSIGKKFFPYQASSSLTLCTLAEGRIFLCTDSCFSSIRILIGNIPPKISLLKVWNSAFYFRKTLNLGTHLVVQEVLLIGGLPYGGIWRLFFLLFTVSVVGAKQASIVVQTSHVPFTLTCSHEVTGPKVLWPSIMDLKNTKLFSFWSRPHFW